MSKNIAIYTAEKEAGIAELVGSNVSVSYISKIEFDASPLEQIKASVSSLDFAKGGERDIDLYYVKSILVTSCWNKNDDVFDKVEIWTARHTPVHKPTNIEHDEAQIVGHITNNWPINSEGGIISEDTSIDDLPDVYHILNSSVIYRKFSSPELQSRANELIKQIESGDKFVSMECFFTGFDYAVRNLETGEHFVVGRNKETAFLTKHLRVYGGEGVYDGHKVGRILRNIIFKGKGYVNEPANPDSVIFTVSDIMPFNDISTKNPFNGVLSNMTNIQSNPTWTTPVETSTSNDDNKENSMSDQILTDKIEELKSEVTAIKADRDSLREKLSKADVQKFEDVINSLKAEKEELETKISNDNSTAKETNQKLEEACSKIETLTESNENLKNELAETKTAQKLTDRTSYLVSGKVEVNKAKEIVDKFVNLDDEQFKLVADMVLTTLPKPETELTDSESKGSDDDSTDANETVADESLLNNVDATDKPKEISLAAESEDENEELNVVRAGLQKFMASRLATVSYDKDEE